MKIVKTLIVTLLLVATLFATACSKRTYKNAVVEYVNGTDVFVRDEDGNGWVFEGTGFGEGHRITVVFDDDNRLIDAWY